LRYFIHFGFKGTNYHGWQIQPGSITVQQVINQNLTLLLKEEIYVVGAGRTDAGVHAPCFFAHFDSLQGNLQQDPKFMYKLNSLLPKDIAIYNIFTVTEEAHSRFDAISRTYLYRISLVKDPFNREFTMHFYKKLDIGNMNLAASILLEYTDFTSFSKLHTDVKTNRCRIYDARWEASGNEIWFTIKADRFLRNMVRAIVGTLIDVGLGKMPPDGIRPIIDKKNRSGAGASADACGLHLINIEYPETIFGNMHFFNYIKS
jgi:tRNA pseudouridine38-40 synthase